MTLRDRVVIALGRTFRHPTPLPIVRYQITEQSIAGAPLWRNCETPYPEPICSCGLYVIEWKR